MDTVDFTDGFPGLFKSNVGEFTFTFMIFCYQAWGTKQTRMFLGKVTGEEEVHFLVLLPQTGSLKLEMALRVFSKTILIIKKNHRTSNTDAHLHEKVIFFFFFTYWKFRSLMLLFMLPLSWFHLEIIFSEE